ncbi:had iiid h [Nannochloropsis oceanica]
MGIDDNTLLNEAHVREADVQSQELYELVAKWRGKEIDLGTLPGGCTIANIKILLEAKTRVLPERQKLIGLSVQGGKAAKDENTLEQLVLKGKRGPVKFMLMGTPEAESFVDPSEKTGLPEVFDDFELDVTAISEEWRRSVQNSENLRKFTAKTQVHLINPPRQGKRLLVLDLDHTLLDFSSREEVIDRLSMAEAASIMKRPHLDAFLAAVYPFYDLVAWSQTSWRWLEIKMVELGLLTHPAYRFCFVLDKTSMFHVESTKGNGSLFKHQVKPLQLIWTKFPHWNETNSVHVDDLSRNFALNTGNGVKIKAYYRNAEGASEDKELVYLGRYLVRLATCGPAAAGAGTTVVGVGDAGGEGGGGGENGGKDHRYWRDEAKRREGGGEGGGGSGGGGGGASSGGSA